MTTISASSGRLDPTTPTARSPPDSSSPGSGCLPKPPSPVPACDVEYATTSQSPDPAPPPDHFSVLSPNSPLPPDKQSVSPVAPRGSSTTNNPPGTGCLSEGTPLIPLKVEPNDRRSPEPSTTTRNPSTENSHNKTHDIPCMGTGIRHPTHIYICHVNVFRYAHLYM